MLLIDDDPDYYMTESGLVPDSVFTFRADLLQGRVSFLRLIFSHI